jgi:hypothetical protein
MSLCSFLDPTEHTRPIKAYFIYIVLPFVDDTKRIVSTRTHILQYTEALEQNSMDQPPSHHPQIQKLSSSCVPSSRLDILLARNLVAIIFGNDRRLGLVGIG